MRTRAAAVLVLAAGAAWAAAPAVRAAAPVAIDEADRPVVEAFLGHAERAAVRCTPERMAAFAAQPEDITWQGSKYIRMALVAYRLTGDPKHLDAFVQRMDALAACAAKGPDGYLGWYGLPYDLFRHPDHPERKVDVLLTSFTVAGLAADFALALEGDAALRARFGEAARRYLALAEGHLVPKWDARGRYKDLGAGGAVYVTHADLKPVKASLTQPHNKHAAIIEALVSLGRATGKDAYLAKAVRLGTRFKRCLALDGDRYRWNYWDPAGPWDVSPEQPGQWKHWIGPEHRGGYYALSLSQAVLLYEHGLVFDRADMERFVRTQTEVCATGDAADPRWARVDGRPATQAYLCPLLAPLDRRVEDLAFGPRALRERLAGKDHSWQGGVVAGDWLEAKYLLCRRWAGGAAAEAAATAQFRAKPAGQALLKELAFEVRPPGYRAPATPADMGIGKTMTTSEARMTNE